MKGKERREKLLVLLKAAKEPLSGKSLADKLGVSRQVIVQDITLLRAQNNNIIATTTGYVLEESGRISRVFKVIHTDEQVEEELSLILDYGGIVEDVFIYHKVYGTVKGDMRIASKDDMNKFLSDLTTGKSSLLMHATSGYHYHTVSAPTELILDLIQEALSRKGFLAELKDYEPVDFWSNEE